LGEKKLNNAIPNKTNLKTRTNPDESEPHEIKK